MASIITTSNDFRCIDIITDTDFDCIASLDGFQSVAFETARWFATALLALI